MVAEETETASKKEAAKKEPTRVASDEPVAPDVESAVTSDPGSSAGQDAPGSASDVEHTLYFGELECPQLGLDREGQAVKWKQQR